jgi:hypothetical protein
MVMTAGSAVPAARTEPGSVLGNIMQSELRRNMERLAQEPVPPYFVSYTVHDVRGSRVAASCCARVPTLPWVPCAWTTKSPRCVRWRVMFA